MIASLKLEAEGAKQGALHRAQYVASALTTKEQWAAAHADVKQQISALQPTVDALRGAASLPHTPSLSALHCLLAFRRPHPLCPLADGFRGFAVG